MIFLLFIFGIALGTQASPTRPPLNEDFSATVNIVLNNKPKGIQEVALDKSKFKVAVIHNYTHPYKKIVYQVLDCQKNVFQVAEPFFNKEICYKEPVVDYLSPSDCWDENLGTILLPLSYNSTDYTGPSTVNGKSVDKWTNNDTQSQTIPFHFNKITINVTLSTINADVYYVTKSGLLMRRDSIQIEKITGIPFHKPMILESNIYVYTFNNVVSPANPSSFNPPSGVTCINDGVSWGRHLREWTNAVFQPQTRLLNNLDEIEAINSAKLGWTAGVAPSFGQGHFQTTGNLRRLLGTFPSRTLNLKANSDLKKKDVSAIPTSFDARQKWTMCPSIGTVRNQGSCSSSWAFATVATLADRFCIASQGKVKLTLSPEFMADCDGTDGNCDGGFLDNAWRFLEKEGVVTENCAPYQHCDYPPNINCSINATTTATHDEKFELGACRTNCSDNSPFKKYYALRAYAVGSPGDVAAMQTEIMTKGPIDVSFFLYQDFYQYTSGVYSRGQFAQGPLMGGPVGGHAVKVIGWGVEGSTPYWLAVNSWSDQWGDKGLFKILRGKNECGFETTPAAGDPAL